MGRTKSRAGAGLELSKSGAEVRAGQERGRSRAEQSKAEQGRKKTGAGQELGRSKECAGIRHCRIGA